VVDLLTDAPRSGAAGAIRRAGELRRKAELVSEAAHAARDNADRAVRNAASTIERSRGICASLFSRRPLREAPPNEASAEEFAAIEFAPADGRRIVEVALRAAVNSTAAPRANIQLVAPDGLRIVSHIGFKDPFLRFFERVADGVPSACGAAHRR